MSRRYLSRMNNEKFHKNVDDIEFKCNKLISEINDHLTLYSEPQTATLNNRQIINNDAENIPDVVVTTCHNKLINFTLNHYEAKKIHKSQITDTIRVHVPKNICVNLTKINQLLIPRPPYHSNDKTDLLDSNLEIHHLKHVNIDPNLTKQVAFKISCPDERSLVCHNVGTFNIIHKDDAAKKSSNLKHQTILDFDKKQHRGEFDETYKICEQNIGTEVNFNVSQPMSHEVRHFLYGNVCKKPFSSPSKNKKSTKVFKRKIKSKNNI